MRLRTALLAAGIAAISMRPRRRRPSTSFERCCVLITGSSRGLGLALAEEFAARGANIVLCARDGNELEAARARVARFGTEVLSVPCDVSDERQVRELIARARGHFTHIDVLVNNAGIITVGPIESQSVDDFRECMDVMYWGVVYPTLAVLPEMRRRRAGAIVNITSIGGKVSVPHLLPYSSAKFAAMGFSEGLRAEVAKDGVRVLTVVPGLMRTGSHANAFFKGRHRLEFGWFSFGASSPLTSIDVRSAARQIVDAAAAGAVELMITPQAQLMARAHGLMPGAFVRLMSVAGGIMPRGADHERHTGRESESAISRSPINALGRQAVREYQDVAAAGND
jgi:short-subunit dehydrogenase